jgi:hypothetical protein
LDAAIHGIERAHATTGYMSLVDMEIAVAGLPHHIRCRLLPLH